MIYNYDIFVNYHWNLINKKEHVYIYIYIYIYIYNLEFLFFNSDACKKQESRRREFIHTKELSGVGTASRNSTSAKILKLTHGHNSSLMQCFFFISHSSPLVTAYTHTFFMPFFYCLFSIGHGLYPHIFYASGITPTHFCFSRSHFVDFYL